jgi:hypothetical protein
MEWVGKATVISLGSGLLARCTTTADLGIYDGTDTPSQSTDPFSPNTRLVQDSKENQDSNGDQDSRTVGGLTDDAGNGTGEVADRCEAAFDVESVTAAPREGSIFDRWPVRTVDEQNLSWILDNWQLTVEGMVDEPQTLSFTDLLNLPSQDQVTDFHCVEGWSVMDVPWNGVHLSELLSLAKPRKEATHITFHTIDEAYNESLSLDVALEPKTLLAYGVNCATLPLDHGFPLRVVIPRLLAYKGPKYVHRVELTDEPISGYWVARGYAYEGEVPEIRLRPGKY